MGAWDSNLHVTSMLSLRPVRDARRMMLTAQALKREKLALHESSKESEVYQRRGVIKVLSALRSRWADEM